MHVGIISDTHGFIDPRLAAAFSGVEAIVHAGDVGGAHRIAIHGRSREGRLGTQGLQRSRENAAGSVM